MVEWVNPLGLHESYLQVESQCPGGILIGVDSLRKMIIIELNYLIPNNIE